MVAAIDDDGNAIWTRRTTGAGDIASLTADDTRAVLVLKFAATVGFDVSHANLGGTDAYVAVLAL